MTTMASANAGNDGAVTPVTSPLQRTTSEDRLFNKQIQQTKLANKFGGSTDSISFRKTLVLDEDRFEQSFLRCRICKELFTDDQRIPKLLPCHHSFCLACVINLFQKEAKYRQSLTPAIRDLPAAVTVVCPTCRANFISTQDGLKHLPIDHRIVQLLDFIRTTDRYTVHYCNTHRGQPLNFFCENCVQPVCRTCTFFSHKEGEGETHLVMDIEDALQKYTPLVDTTLAEMESELKEIDDSSSGVDSAASKLDKVRDDLLTQVHDAFGRLRKLLNEREKELVDMSNREVHSQKRRLAQKVEAIRGRREMLREHTRALRQTKEEGKVEDMFKAHQKSQELRKAKPADPEPEEDDGTVTTFSFRGDDEDDIGAKILNFGDILSQVEEDMSRINMRNSSVTRYGK